ncbi:hypothetical protein F444_22673, partial [Phytophthora nicotianae P1976]
NNLDNGVSTPTRVTGTSRATTTQATMQTTSSSANSTDPPAYFVMEGDLKPWEPYSLDGAEEPETLDTMKDFFARCRAIRGKRPTSRTHTIPCSARCALLSDAGTARDVKACSSRPGSKTARAIGATTLLASGESPTCTLWKAVRSALRLGIDRVALNGSINWSSGHGAR